MILPSGGIQFTVVNANSSSRLNTSWYQFIIFVLCYYQSYPLWHYMIRLTHLLSEIGYIIPASNSFITSGLTTSCIAGLSLLYGSLDGLQFSSRCILCITNEGLIPLISSMVQLMTSLCSFKTSNSFSS